MKLSRGGRRERKNFLDEAKKSRVKAEKTKKYF